MNVLFFLIFNLKFLFSLGYCNGFIQVNILNGV